jgi:HK97 family phage major capsid protein/HK97 family phage prohead protease
MNNNSWDFGGWATVIDRECTDGRTIRKGAFKANDGKTVPLVWNHQHNDPANVLGHALLKDYPEGTYAFGKFNDTESGRNAKMLVDSGDIESLSIYAAQLKQNGGDVLHGDIKEVSLVLAGANPGAYIDQILSHSDGDSDDSAVIYMGEELFHGDDFETPDEDEDEDEEDEEDEEDDDEEYDDEDEDDALSHADEKEEEDDEDDGKTVGDVLKTLNREQKIAMAEILRQLIDKYEGGKKDDEDDEEDEGEKTMKHNVFDSEDKEKKNVLSHADEGMIIGDAKRFGSLKESVLAHSQEYGIENINLLFPDYKNVQDEPVFLKRPDSWVSKVMGGVHHVPFAKIRSMYADITADAARAKGYTKGNEKTEEVFALFKRETPPTTVYKKQKMDRDDMLDITDFNTVSWLKREMRMMLDEEIARAILVGDGRSAVDNDRINKECIRPIYTDTAQELYAFHVPVTVAADDTEDSLAKKTIRAIIKARKDYRGTGTPTFFCTEDTLTNMLLLEDLNGRVIYDTMDKLATALRVKEIVTVPVMDNQTRTVESGAGAGTYTLAGILVNLDDYRVGANRGGEVTMFDDFDIDYNQQKYLIETRCSGALVVPKSAMIVEMFQA